MQPPAVRRGWEALAGLGSAVLDLLYPPLSICAACDAPLEARLDEPAPLCGACRAALVPRPVSGGCPRCGTAAPGSSVAGLCRRCRSDASPVAWWRALGPYDGPIRAAVRRLKYQGGAWLDEPLGRAMAAAVRAWAPGPVDAVVPVPLHSWRYRSRGYNQAWLVACVLARELGLPFCPRWLARRRVTRPQVRLDEDARRENVARAFRARARLVRPEASVLLVDDVRTTGATLDACARALRAAGAGRVLAVVLAEAERGRDA